MAQYYAFLILVPIAFIGSILALILPRLVHSYHRFVWLRIFNYMQLGYLAVNLVELLARSPALKQSLASMDYLFIGAGPSVWLLFSLEYTGMVRDRRPWQALLFVMPAVACAAGFVNGGSGLLWRDLHFEQLGWVLAMSERAYGPVALAMFAQAYCAMLVGSFILIKHTALSHALFRRQTSWMMAGVVIPLLFNLAFILKLVPGWNKDYSALAASIGGLFFSVGCLRYRLFSVVPVSREAVFQQIRTGVVVTDEQGVIVDLNQAACRMIGASEVTLLGKQAQLALEPLYGRVEQVRHPMHGPDGRLQAWHIELREAEGESVGEGPDDDSEAMIRAEEQFLSLGELRVIEMLAEKLSNKEIADRLGVSVNTVKFHLSNAYKKTGAHSRAELLHQVAYIVNNRLV